MTDWIQGDKFQAIADYTYAPQVKAGCDYASFNNTLDLNTLRDGAIIYTQGFHHYKKHLLNIIKDTKEVILISHNCDDGIDGTYDIPDNVIRWYAQNVNLVHPRLKAIPVGLENDIRDFGVCKKEKMVAKRKQPRDIKNLVYVDHRMWTYPTERVVPYNVLRDKPWATLKTDEDNIKFDEYIDNVYNHKFVVCPRGNGIGTHRPWEALYMGTIPIKRRNINNQFFTDLPICFVDEWEEMTEDFLNKEYDRIKGMSYNEDMLTFTYWKDKILNFARWV